ncbi:MAG: helix-turn-helix domain-containing protein [Zoogloea sp.]|jgi:Helix-turn-helix.|nr:helix-turn-helix domain-containing protein [Zoogloea sp.]
MSPDHPTPQDFPAARAVLSANLVRFRRERGWSQEKLAFESGLDRSFIAHVERQARNIALDNIERLARTLGVPVHVLLTPPAD